MQLSTQQVSLLARRARSLPDDVLAGLALEHILAVPARPASATQPAHDDELKPIAAGPMLTEQRFDGADHQRLVQVFRKRPAPSPVVTTTPEKRVTRLVAFVEANPGCAMRDMVKGLAEDRQVLGIAARAAKERDLIESRGDRRATRYFLKQTNPEAT